MQVANALSRAYLDIIKDHDSAVMKMAVHTLTAN